jgi:phenylalanyl-tRNA synthetase beta chain
MKISYNWLLDYIPTKKSPEEVGEILTQTGLEVEGIGKIQSVPGGLEGIVIGEVVEKKTHPNADRLSVTKVNIGQDEILNIVCGAPNVAQGQKVLVATIGSKLYPSEGEPFTIKKGKIRGEASEGMICAEDELGIGKSHDGIMVLDPSAVPGTPAAHFLGLKDDFAIEIGLTPNRTDAMCHIGVARDLAAALHTMHGIEREIVELSLPDISRYQENPKACPIKVTVLDKDRCPRYCGVLIENLKVEASPGWLQDKLRAIGLSPINNLVDITNFVLHEWGQPLHAFDADQIEGNEIVVTTLKSGSKLSTLDEVERTLDEQDLVICNSLAHKGDKHNQAGMCIAGVFGGINSGVSPKTTRVFLESAYFNPVSVRKTARRHGLNTDSSFRFERGVDPTITIKALQRAALLMCEIGGGKIVGGISDSNKNEFPRVAIEVNTDRICRLIGQKIDTQHIRDILLALDFEFTSESGANWTITAPQYRVDVTREADVIEEILRIYGYDNIELPTKLNASLSYSKGKDRESIQNKMSDFLSSSGWNEIMSNSLTKSEYATWINEDGIQDKFSVRMLNPLSSDLDAMRQSLLFQGLEAIALNQNHRNPNLQLYEFGKAYFKKEESGYREDSLLSLFITGFDESENWNHGQKPADFTKIKAPLDAAMLKFGIDSGKDELLEGNAIFSQRLQRKVRNKVLCTLGTVNQALLKKFDIKQTVYFADIDWDLFIESVVTKHPVFKTLPKFPEMRRDLSLLVDTDKNFAEISQISRKQDKKILRDVGLFDVYEGKNLPEGKKSYAVSFVFRDDDKTLTDKQVDKIMAQIQDALGKELGAELR